MKQENIVTKQRINSLTATRGIAALAVVIYHFGCDVFPFNKAEHFFRTGNIAVSYFFVLSGFVMSWTYLDRNVGYADFMKRRAIRIFPFYYLAMVLALVLPLYYLYRYQVPLEEQFTIKLLLNSVFGQAYFPEYALSINSPGWSLSVEMFFYLLFPFFLKFQQRKIQLFFWFVVAFFIISQLVHFYQLHSLLQPTSYQHSFIYYFPLFHLNEFLVGMMGALLLPIVIKRGIRIPWFVVLALILLLVYFGIRGTSLHNGFLAPLFLLLILALSIRDAGWMKGRFPVFMGEMSYGVYILQFPVYILFAYYNERHFHLNPTASFYVYLLVLFCTTIAGHYLVERPLRKLILKV